MIAAANSSAVALGITPYVVASRKIGRVRSVHWGQIAAAGAPLRAHRIPATNVPCMQALLSA
jgi:hypothetical protein